MRLSFQVILFDLAEKYPTESGAEAEGSESYISDIYLLSSLNPRIFEQNNFLQQFVWPFAIATQARKSPQSATLYCVQSYVDVFSVFILLT